MKFTETCQVIKVAIYMYAIVTVTLALGSA